MTAEEIRQKYFRFFESKKHKVIDSASLIPENDPTVLFTTAGMHPLVPYLMGEKHPQGTRLVNAQKCIRTGDIDEVGDTAHHTFFEMLGNWSLGDYFKREAIEWSFEFLTKELGIPLKKMAVSVFAGDSNSSFDNEAYQVWLSLGVPEARIVKLGKTDNWWGPAGETGPCGPDSEIFIWMGKGDAPTEFDPKDLRWIEVWNDVFMQYNKTFSGKFELLAQKNVDTGMGLERILAVMNNLDDNYKTELFWPVIKKIEEISEKNYEENKKEMRVIADHIKAAVFIVGDNKGIVPGNLDQGYVIRKLIRRAIRYGKIIGISNLFIAQLGKIVVKIYQDVYCELEKNKAFILEEFKKEEEKFNKTLERGLNEFKKIAERGNISGKEAFNLFATYGFPLEMTEELAGENNLKVNASEFKDELQKHQDLSRTASAGKFKGGLADAGEETKKLHTAAHLLLESLRRILGPHIEQRGSNITAQRLRFDFSHTEKLTDDQKQKVEDLVNEQIKKALPVNCMEMSVEEAKAQGAIGIFIHKYGKKVKVYNAGDFSREICGGPHVKNTRELGKFKIKKEQSSSSGVRRIKAVLE